MEMECAKKTIEKRELKGSHKHFMGFWLQLQTTQIQSTLKNRTGEPTVQVDRLLETTHVVWSLVVLGKL